MVHTCPARAEEGADAVPVLPDGNEINDLMAALRQATTEVSGAAARAEENADGVMNGGGRI